MASRYFFPLVILLATLLFPGCSKKEKKNSEMALMVAGANNAILKEITPGNFTEMMTDICGLSATALPGCTITCDSGNTIATLTCGETPTTCQGTGRSFTPYPNGDKPATMKATMVTIVPQPEPHPDSVVTVVVLTTLPWPS